MRILVLGHSDITSTYGAATSIRNHFKAFREIEGYEFYHLYRKSILGHLKKKCDNFLKIAHLDDFWIETDDSIFEHNSPGIIRELYGNYIPNLIAKSKRKNFLHKIKSIRPGIIHLNSITLWPLIHLIKSDAQLQDVKIILHIRELCSKSINIAAKNSFKEVDHIVFIDQSVYNRFISVYGELSRVKSSVVQNPFDATDQVDLDIASFFEKDLINFCTAGVITKDKGVDFIVRAFSLIELQNIRLNVIGKINAFARKIIKENQTNKVKFCGEVRDLASRGAFNFIDCIIRGEDCFCTGRTTYEILYAGGYVVMPGKNSDIDQDENLKIFNKNIFTYHPRNEKSLQDAIKNAASAIAKNKTQKKHRSKESNFQAYCKKIGDAYKGVTIENLSEK